MNKPGKSSLMVRLALCGALMGGTNTAMAVCTISSAVDHDTLKTVLANAVTSAAGQGGLNNRMWLTMVDRNGVICDVVFSGNNRHRVWKGSRAISAQKAYTGIAFSTTGINGFALSSANLYAPTQPQGTLYGLQESIPWIQGSPMSVLPPRGEPKLTP